MAWYLARSRSQNSHNYPMLGVEFHKLYVWTPSTKGIVRVTFPPILSPPKAAGWAAICDSRHLARSPPRGGANLREPLLRVTSGHESTHSPALSRCCTRVSAMKYPLNSPLNSGVSLPATHPPTLGYIYFFYLPCLLFLASFLPSFSFQRWGQPTMRPLCVSQDGVSLTRSHSLPVV